MSLVGMQELLLDAQKKRYAVAAFNVENMEMVQIVIETAQQLHAPVILQTTPSTVKYAGLTMFRAMVEDAAQKVSVPVVLHLDHGDSFALCEQALAAEYTSIMIDGSKLPYEKNIQLTRSVVELSTKLKIDVEGELGTVSGKEDSHMVMSSDQIYTDPSQAADFVKRTGVMSLAVAIGTAHGFYKGEPKLDYGRLQQIVSMVDIPIVLHGASGVPDVAVQKCVQLGCCKVNFATELREAFTNGIRGVLEDSKVYDPKVYMREGKAHVAEIVTHKIAVCGCGGMARC